MKKLILSAILVFVASIMFAQTNKEKLSNNVLQQIEVLKSSGLNLNDIQIRRITTVLISEDEVRARFEKTLAGNKSLLETKLVECKANLINNVKGGMTVQQVEKFDAIHLGDQLFK
jgi:hypothetical protein